MKKIFINFSFIVFTLSTFAALPAAASVADDQAKDLLIKKFTRVYSQLADSDQSKVPVTLRLADLLSEKARRLAMKELDSGCIQCVAGKRERTEALRYYKEVVPKLSRGQRSRVLSQMGHLYEMSGNTPKAVALYQQVLKSEERPELLADAEFSLAELFFRQRKFSQALRHYNQALGFNELTRKGLASYRKAWCLFSLGQIERAKVGLVEILNSPKLLTRSASAAIVSVDKHFQEEVSRDLATFYSKSNVNSDQVKELYNLSPKEARISNMTFLASELERMGNKLMAISVWRFVQGKQTDPSKRLEGNIRLAQLELDLKNRSASVQEYLKALRQWSSLGTCGESACREWKSRMRKYVIDWNREEKKAPSEELFEVYKEYSLVFPKEADMLLWGAQVAEKRGQHLESMDLRIKALPLVAGLLPREIRKQKLISHETLLLLVIEAAEKSKEALQVAKAHQLYLKESKEKSKIVEVKYQVAHDLYKKEQYQEAAHALRAVALMTEKQSQAVKKQAADLALDALVILKKDSELEEWANDFASVFKADSRTYQNIARKSVLNQSAQLAASGAGSLLAAWNTLGRMNIESASEAEKIAFYKNRLILAERLKKYEEASLAANHLLGFKSLKKEDRQFALSRKAWLAELKLDFPTAYKIMAKLETPDLSREQRLLKLGLFAELAKANSVSYYQKYIKVTADKDKAQVLAVKLIRESKTPQKEIEKLKHYFKANEALLAQLQYEVYLQRKDLKRASRILSKAPYAATPAGRSFWRQSYLKRLAGYRAKISADKIDSRSQRRLAKSLSRRIKHLDRGDKLLKEAIASKDWTGQMLTVKLLADESNRFYEEILALPMPKGLEEQQQMEYMQLLSQQAAPYQIKASELSQKFSEFWTGTNVVEDLKAGLRSASSLEREVLLTQLNKIAEVAPGEQKTEIVALGEDRPVKKALPSLIELEGARRAVRTSPMDPAVISQLIGLEERMGSTAMVTYLRSRLSQTDRVPAKETSSEM